MFPNGKDGKKQDHTTYSERIVQETEIKEIIDKHFEVTGVSSKDVLNILNKKTLGPIDNFIKQIYDSEIDTDRMDYLLRDNLFTGVEYGRFDSDRLIETLSVFEKEDGSLNLGVEERGLHAVEGLLLARYFMFLQVYFHNIRRIYDIHLLGLIKEALEEETKKDTYPDDIQDYLSWDDTRILNYARCRLATGTSDCAMRILLRNHYLVIYETSDHAQGGEIENFKEKILQLKSTIGENYVIEDTSLKAPYLFDYRKGEEKLNIIPFRGKPKDIAQMSRLVDNLPEIYKLRAYVHPSYRDKVLPLL